MLAFFIYIKTMTMNHLHVSLRRHGLRVVSLLALPALLLQTTGFGVLASALPAMAATVEEPSSPPLTLAASDTSFRSPTGQSQNGPSDGWANPERAFSDGNGFASDNDGDRHRYSDFGFSVPSGATIDGIEVRIDARSTDAAPFGCQIGVDLSWNGGSGVGWSDEKTYNLTRTETRVTLGGPSDLWGSHAWSASEFSDPNFRVRVRDIDPGSDCTNNATTELDWVQANIHYTPQELPDPDPNPVFPRACGLDVALVLDSSASIDETELGQMKTAFHGFVDAFLPGTPTMMSVSEFDTTASVTQPFTADANLVKNAIDAATSGGFTNWDDGLAKAQSTFDPRPAKPNLVLFASDGNPNKYGNPALPPGLEVDEFAAMSAAITRANGIKASDTRIVALGIGDDLNEGNLVAISGPIVSPPAPVDENADVIRANFDTLADTLANLAKETCGGKILVQKQLDTDGDGDVDLDGSISDPRLAGWSFVVSDGSSDPAPKTTSETGALEFDVLNGTYSLTETNQQPGTRLLNASCRIGEQPVGELNLETRTISGLVMDTDDTISCVFVNQVEQQEPETGTLTVIKQVSGGTALSSDWLLHVRDGEVEVPNSPQPGSASGTTYTLPVGTYTVSESNGPAGYAASFSESCANGTAIVVAEHETICTVTNTAETHGAPDLDVKKFLLADGQYPNDPAFETDDFDYRIVVENQGNETATDVQVVDTHFAGFVFEASVLQDGTPIVPVVNGQTLTWSIGNVEPGVANIKTVYIKGHFDSALYLQLAGSNPTCSRMTNSVTVAQGANPPIPETVFFNNTDTETTFGSYGLCTRSVTIEKTGQNTAKPGESITYTLKWAAGGTLPVTNLVISDTLPATLIFVSGTQGVTNNAGVLTWNLGNHIPGDNGTVSITATVGADLTNGTVITNTATIDSSETEPLSSSKTTTVTAAPILTVSKSVNLPFANPGDQPTYSVTVTNAGNDAATNVVLTDTLPAGFTFVDGGTATKSFTIGSLAKNASITVLYAVTVGTSVAAGTYDNTATVTASNHGPVTAKAPLEVRVPVVAGVTTPSLTISKEVDKQTANPGDTLTYVIRVTNSGDVDLQDVRLTDTLPSDFRFSDTGSTKRSWVFGTLLAGEVRTVTYDVRVSESAKAGIHENTAVALAKDLDPEIATASVDVRVPKVLGALTETGASRSDLAILLVGIGLVMLASFGLRRLRQFPA